MNMVELRLVRTIVTHENCADGVASAILLHDALPDARVVFVQYGTEALAKLVAEPGMLFCDFCPPAERADEFIAAGAIVLDHHRTAKDVVARFGDRGIFADETNEPGVSGALLAFEHVWRPRLEMLHGRESTARDRARNFARMVGIRDTWQREATLWRVACEYAEALRFYPPYEWCEIADPFGYGYADFSRMLGIGRPLLERHEADVARALSSGYRTSTTEGTRLLVFEGLALTSDVADAAGETTDVVAGFGFEVDGGRPKMIVSLRSRGTYDVAQLTKRYGGGGHTKAAGFHVEIGSHTSNPYRAIEVAIDHYESTR